MSDDATSTTVASAAPVEGLATGRPGAATKASDRSLAMRASAWALLGYGSAQVLRLGSNLVLTRLLAPDAFGLMALVNVFLTGLQMFSDFGIEQRIVQHGGGEDPRFLRTAWTVQVLRGLALTLIALLIAWPASVAYDARLLTLLAVCGLSATIGGFASTSVALARRNLAIGRLTLIDLTTQALAITTMVVWALASPGVWALVAGTLVGAASRTVLTYRLPPPHPSGFGLEKSHVRELASFGGWIFVSTIFGFLATNIDRLILGRLLTPSVLGVYSVALSLAVVPAQVFSVLAGNVYFPLLSRAHRAGELGKAFERARSMILFLAALLVIPLVIGGHEIVRVLFDPRWHDAGWMLQILAAGVWLLTQEMTANCIALVKGQTRWIAAATATRLLCVSAGLPLAYALGGLPAAIAVTAAADLPRYVVAAIGASRLGHPVLAQDGVRTFAIAAALGLGLLAARMPHWPHPIVGVAAGSLAGVLAWTALRPGERRLFAREGLRLWSALVARGAAAA